MDEQIKQIAERLRGLRDALELSPEEVAKACQLSVPALYGRVPADGKRDGGYLGKRVASDCADVWRGADDVDVWR